jgi:hypothetical protein
MCEDTIEKQLTAVIGPDIQHCFGLTSRSLWNLIHNIKSGWIRILETTGSLSKSASSIDKSASEVPRGSVLLSMRLIVYASLVSNVTASFDVRCHPNADDTQMYLSLGENAQARLVTLVQCTAAVRQC